MGSRTEYHRKYQEKRRLERLAIAKERLGGKCSHPGCEKTENLEFDHIIPGTKLRKVSEATNWKWERFLTEVDKCQLFCVPHHNQKTTAAGERARGEHNGKSKVTEVEVKIIRSSDLPLRKLATEFKISHTTVLKIKLRESWKHVE